jgi:hypothetical protein
LSEPNSTGSLEKFGVVIDNGTSIYATQIFNSIENVISVCDIDGYVITNEDQLSFNRFPLNPSPEFLIDIYSCYGFTTIEANILEHRTDNLPLIIGDYKLNYSKKHYYFFQILSFGKFFKYIVWEVLNYLFYRESDYIHFNDYNELKGNHWNRNLENTGKQNTPDSKKRMLQMIKSYVKKKPGLKAFALSIDKIYLGFKSQILDLAGGRFLISFVFRREVVKNEIDELNRTTLHYVIRYDQKKDPQVTA